MRRSPIEEGRRWLEQAKEDLKMGKRLGDIACFLSQQV